MQRIYCLSGLGADESIFANLEIPGTELVHLPWAEYDEEDSLPGYAERMMQMISENEPVILGVSFGGMLAIEIAKRKKVKRTILISSAKHTGEIPHFHGLMKALVVSQVLPGFFYKMPNKFVFERFGAVMPEEKEVMRKILKRADGQFMSWAMRAVQQWQNTTVPVNVLHIHGTADKIISPENIRPDHWIQDGSHMMIYNRAKEIARLIHTELYTAGRVGYRW